METGWITEIALTGIGVLLIFMLKWIKDDIKGIKQEVGEGFEKIGKEMNDRFDKVDLRFEKTDKKIDNLQTSMHDLDLRMTTIEAEHRIYPWPMVVNEKPEIRRRPGRPKRVLAHKE